MVHEKFCENFVPASTVDTSPSPGPCEMGPRYEAVVPYTVNFTFSINVIFFK